MNTYLKYFTLGLLATSAFILSGCEETTPVQQGTVEEIEYTNSYEYDGNTFDVKSVVRYETETTVEMWLSPSEGLKSIGDVVENGNYGVVSVNRTYLGGRDLFKKSGTYAGFNEMRFSKGQNAKAYIEMSFEEENVTIQFKIETLFSEGEAVGKEFSGNYKGSFVDHSLVLDNQWSLNRIAKNITGGKVFITSDSEYNTQTRFSFFDDEAYMHEAFSLTIPEESIGSDITDLGDVIEITYDNGKKFDLASSANITRLITSLTDNLATIDMDLVNGNNYLAANFSGNIELNEKKPNHIACKIYEKNGNGDFEHLTTRRTPIHKLFVRAGSSTTILYFGMSENATSDNREYYPTLSIETKLADGQYHFGTEALGRFKYSDDHTTISDQPFDQGTMYVEQTSSSSYKIILRVKDLFITGSKKADIEVFYEGQIN